MKLLVLDTATEACSVALENDGAITARFEICPQQHSQRLLPMVDEVLKDAGITLKELDALAFGRGPGSFTGVRIATGMIQGLALGTGLRVAGISTLHAMAQQAFAETDKNVFACALDARMGEVYFAIYTRAEQGVTLLVEEQVCPPEHAVELLAAISEPYATLGTGWEAYEVLNALKGQDVEVTITLPAAEFMVPVAIDDVQKGAVSDAATVKPVYLRDKVTWKKLPGRE